MLGTPLGRYFNFIALELLMGTSTSSTSDSTVLLNCFNVSLVVLLPSGPGPRSLEDWRVERMPPQPALDVGYDLSYNNGQILEGSN